jgi:hypothetical protein
MGRRDPLVTRIVQGPRQTLGVRPHAGDSPRTPGRRTKPA